jgi:hypothetical protein
MTATRMIAVVLGGVALAGAAGTGIFLTRHQEWKGPEMTETNNVDKQAKLLTSEQMAMWRREHRGEMKGLSKEEKKAGRKKLIAKLEAMSHADLEALRTKLQGEWNALPADQKKKLQEKMDKRADKKPAGGMEEDDED